MCPFKDTAPATSCCTPKGTILNPFFSVCRMLEGWLKHRLIFIFWWTNPLNPFFAHFLSFCNMCLCYISLYVLDLSNKVLFILKREVSCVLWLQVNVLNCRSCYCANKYCFHYTLEINIHCRVDVIRLVWWITGWLRDRP